MAASRTGRRTRVAGANRTWPARSLRILLWGSLGLVAFTLVLVLLAVPATLGVRQRLDDGRQAMEQARDAVVEGDARRALIRFRAARVSFDEADAQTDGGALGLAALLPIVGPNIETVRSIATAGSKTAAAGIEVARAVGSLPGGLEALAPAGGRIPLERFPPLADAVARAHTLVGSAVTDVRSSSTSLLLPPVEDARWQAETSLTDLDTTLASAATTLERLPAFLGAEGPRTYLFGAESPSELRGTGGLIGAYALLRADDGRLSFSSFRPVQTLPLLKPDDVPPPNDDYHRLYDPQRAGNGFWLNVNMTPDFPSAAQAFAAAFGVATGEQVDGVVTADPFALQALLGATGPATVPGLGVRVTADTVVPFLANRAYARIEDPAERKLVLGAVAESVVRRFLVVGGARRAVRALADTAAESHVKLYSTDPDLEEALAETGAGGAFRVPAPPADFLSVVVNNGGANKVDYYVDREVRYAVTLEDDGTASATTDVRLTNHAPDHGLPAYVLGPIRGVTTRPGQDVSILNVYCGLCRLTRATRNGTSFDPGSDHELSSNFFQDYYTIDPGAATTTSFAYALPRTWAGDASGGTYSLRFLSQPTIRATDLTIRIRVPDGMHVIDASSGVQVEGSVATWSGTPSRTLTIDLSFAPPLPERLWHELTG